MERFMKAKVRSERTMSKEQPACKRVSLQWLEDTKAELERRVEALEDAQHDTPDILFCCKICCNIVEPQEPIYMQLVTYCKYNLIVLYESTPKENQPSYWAQLCKYCGNHNVIWLISEKGMVNVRLGKLENAVERSLTSVHHCIDNLLLNLGEKEKEEARGIADIPVEDDAAFPVHLAAQVGNLAAVKALVLAGVDVGIRNQRGKTVLQIAAAGGHSEIVELLLRQHQDSEDDLQSAAAQEQLQEALMNAVDSSVNKDCNGWTALHCAAFNKWPECVKVLLRYGVDIALTNSRGESALHLAACLSTAERDSIGDASAALAQRTQVIKLLLSAGADPNVQSKDGRTALQQDGVQALLQVPSPILAAHLCS
ncbi:uncharacterized protein GBIM_14648 [Gryllus bimaculatus]|nr:uncharacterized protein GBIM_14648 [Gryllus bimaculatus]